MESIARHLVLTAKAMRAHFEAHLVQAGATLPFWLVLEQLSAQDGLSQRELSRRLSVEAPTLTRHIDRMEAEGLLSRTPDAKDRRVTRIHLTDAGRRLHQRLLGVAQQREAALRSILTPREAAVLDRVLTRITDYVEQDDAAAG
jgi:MarR family transcriptional regulator for hemolysin